MEFDPVTTAELPSRVVTELHLFRHGAVDTGGVRQAYGHLDLALSPLGRAQHLAQAALAATLPAPHGVLSSDLQRCVALGQTLAQARGLDLQTFPALREQSMGHWEGRAWGALSEEQPQAIQDYWDDYVGARPPGGESLQDLSERVDSWWQAQWPTLQGGQWWIAGHAGVIRVLLCKLLNHPLDQALRFAPARGSYTHLLLADSGAVVNVLGERAARPRLREQCQGLQVALSGSAGVGKSTLGAALAKDLDLPFIPEGMRKRLEAGLMLHRLSREELRALVHSLWEEQQELEAAAMKGHGGFVSDRGAMDYASFYLHYGFTGPQDGTAAFLQACIDHARRYTRTVVLPWGSLPLVEDGIRSPNPWMQRGFQALVEGMVHRELPAHKVLWLPPAVDELRERVAWIRGDLGL